MSKDICGLAPDTGGEGKADARRILPTRGDQSRHDCWPCDGCEGCGGPQVHRLPAYERATCRSDSASGALKAASWGRLAALGAERVADAGAAPMRLWMEDHWRPAIDC